MKKHMLFLLLFAVSGSLIFASCGGSPTSPSNPGGAPPPAATPTPVATAITPVTPPLPSPTPFQTYSYAVTETNVTGTFSYTDNIGVTQTVSLPSAGVSWASPVFTTVAGSGRIAYRAFNFTQGSGTSSFHDEMKINGSINFPGTWDTATSCPGCSSIADYGYAF